MFDDLGGIAESKQERPDALSIWPFYLSAFQFGLISLFGFI
jgi:hypothetical protein